MLTGTLCVDGPWGLAYRPSEMPCLRLCLAHRFYQEGCWSTLLPASCFLRLAGQSIEHIGSNLLSRHIITFHGDKNLMQSWSMGSETVELRGACEPDYALCFDNEPSSGASRTPSLTLSDEVRSKRTP
jgi:hypothetical protein